MSMKLPARPFEIDLTHSTPLLLGCMQRFVIDNNIAALREFEQLGIPLDYALDYAVKKGNMPLIGELLNNFGVVPSNSTLLQAMRRGVTIRNMFMNCVTPTVEHLNAAVHAENYDTANLLLDRGIQPNALTLAAIKPTTKQTEDRSAFVARIVAGTGLEVLRQPGSLKKLLKWTTVAQFERTLDRFGEMREYHLKDFFEEALYCAAPGHARLLIHKGARFEPHHFDVVSRAVWSRSDTNPTGEFLPVMQTVLETAIDEQCQYNSLEPVEWLARQLVSRYAFSAPQLFTSMAALLAKACTDELRPEVGRVLVTQSCVKQIRNRQTITMAEMSDLEDVIRPMFSSLSQAFEDAPGCTR